MYIAQWSDPDIGFAGDDFVGCDSALSMGYAYNAVPRDTLYAEVGLVPPAVGYDYLYGPLVAGKEGEDLNRNGVDDAVDHGIRGFHRVGPGFINLPMTSFTFFDSHYVDPPYSYSAGIAMFQMMLGHPFYPLGPPYGAPIDDPITGRRTRYWVNGDPVSGEGWLDGLLHPAGERRIVLSSGPFSMAIGDTQEVAVAWIGGLGIDHKNSVRVLKSNDASVQAFFDSTLIVSGVSNGLREIPVGFILAQNYPNPFNPSTTIRYGLPSRSHVTLTVFNTLGQQAATLVEGEQEGGVYEAVFDASGLASGVYLYRLQAGGFVQVRKLMVLR
jgi:hypothetical protein